MDWIASLLTFWALWLNGRRNIACWPMWLISNVLWIVYAWWRKEWALFAVNIGFILLNFAGWRQWAYVKPKKKVYLP
jgi:nicotinamide riboside transporter PnuC